jgi:hypothetical protein
MRGAGTEKFFAIVAATMMLMFTFSASFYLGALEQGWIPPGGRMEAFERKVRDLVLPDDQAIANPVRVDPLGPVILPAAADSAVVNSAG